jgi:adenine-specific DNA-methyltransferase
LPAGRRHDLVRTIVRDFCPRFTPGGALVHVHGSSDTARRLGLSYLERLGVSLDRGRMPDVVVHRQDRSWLVLVDAVTGHGAIDTGRTDELQGFFKATTGVGLVFVTACRTRRALAKCQERIAWGTVVWVADTPSHLIHFDGGQLQGPYI